MELKAEDLLILSCVKLEPNAMELDQINSLIPQVQDWDYLIKAIIDRGIGPLFFKKLTLLSNSSQIPENIKNKLQQVYYKTLSRSTILYMHFRKIAEAFAVENIPVIVLKGIYLSEWLYQDIGLRQFSDIDLLVKEEDGLKCLAILAELGYKPIDDIRSNYVKNNLEIIHYPPMVLNGASIEIHIKLQRKSEKYHLFVDDLWKNAISETVNNTFVFALNNNDLLIHLCIHLDKHFREGHVQFTCFNDITNLLDKVANIIDWKVFGNTCRKYNCENIVFKYIVMVNKYMNAIVPKEIIEKNISLLTVKDEQLFIKYLKGFTSFTSGVPAYLGSIQNLKTLSQKFRFIWNNVFPPKAFMMNKYLITDKGSVIPKRRDITSSINNKHKRVFHLPLWCWYPYRWWVGVKGVWKVISGK